MKYFALIVLAVVAFAKTADPVTDTLRYEIAAAQRDYLALQLQLEQARARILAKMNQAESVCKSAGFNFNRDTLECK